MGLANVAYVADFSAINQVCFSAKDKAYASYTYTVPAGKSGTATLSLLDERMTLSSNTRLCIMKNDTVVWPEGADLRTPSSWAPDRYNSMDAISRRGALTLPVEEENDFYKHLDRLCDGKRVVGIRLVSGEKTSMKTYKAQFKQLSCFFRDTPMSLSDAFAAAGL